MLKLFLILFTVSISAQSWWWSWSTDDTQAPSVVTNPSAVGNTNKVTLTWTDPTESDFDSVRIYAGTSANPTTWVASVAKGVQFYKDSNYTYNTIRHYRIKAKDKSGNLSAYTSSVNDTVMIWLGSELVVNGTFGADTDWAKTGQFTISGGVLNATSDGTYSNAIQSKAMTVGHVYRVSYVGASITGTIRILYPTDGTSIGTVANGANNFSYTSLTASGDFGFRRVTACSGTIDNVSIKRILNP